MIRGWAAQAEAIVQIQPIGQVVGGQIFWSIPNLVQIIYRIKPGHGKIDFIKVFDFASEIVTFATDRQRYESRPCAVSGRTDSGKLLNNAVRIGVETELNGSLTRDVELNVAHDSILGNDSDRIITYEQVSFRTVLIAQIFCLPSVLEKPGLGSPVFSVAPDQRCA